MGNQLLHVGINSTTPVATDKKGLGIASDSYENSEAKPFSSELDEQVEKQSSANKKRDESQKNEPVEANVTVEKKEAKSESAKESGKKNPEDVAVNLPGDLALNDKAENVDVPTDSELRIIESSEQTNSSNIASGEDVTEEALAVVGIAGSQLTDAKEPESYVSINSSQTEISNAPKLSKQTLDKPATSIPQESATSLPALSTEVDDGTPEVETKPVVRSDIFHTILKKEPSKAEGGVIKEFQATAGKQLELGLGKNKASSESGVKLDTLPLLKPLSERSISPFSSSLMSTSTAVASAANTLAPHVSSVGQSVLTMQPAIQSEAWGKVLSSRVVWMAREGVQQAELRLNPANLGPVEVKLHMNNDQASIAFVAAHAATRDALEQALPRLKESFQDNGMNLANTDVSDHASEQQAEEQENNANNNLKQSAIHGDNGNEELLDQQPTISQGELEIGVSVFA